MISFAPTQEQRLACDAAAGIATRTLAPNARAADEAARLSSAVLDQVWALGLVANLACNDDAFDEQPTLLNVQALENLAAGDSTVAMALAGPLGFVRAIAEQGSERQRQDILPLYAEDRFRAAALAIADTRSTVRAGGTKATATSDGFRIDGAKSLVPLARDCSHFLVTAGLDGAPAAFIAPRDAVGLRVAQAPGLLGLRALEMADVVLDGVLLPRSARLGETADCNVDRLIDSARVALCAVMTGLSTAVYKYSLPYTQDRVVHGEAIGRKQSVAFKLADMHIAIDAMRWMTWKAADELDKNPQARRASALARRFCAQCSMSIADEGVQIFGGHGFVRDLPLEMWLRNARTISVLEGLIGA